MTKLTVPVAAIAAAAAAATGVLIMVERPEPARPTRTMPVLVTGGSVAMTEAEGIAAPAIADPVPVGLADGVGAIAPPMPMAADDAGAGFADRPIEGGDAAQVLGAIAGCEAVVPPDPDTVMTTVGLPAPHLAETWYFPALTPPAIVAVPEKLIDVFVIEACPPAKAAE